MSLISESDLLSKGLEQRYMNIFSKEALDEIKSVQSTARKEIIDAKIESI